MENKISLRAGFLIIMCIVIYNGSKWNSVRETIFYRKWPTETLPGLWNERPNFKEGSKVGQEHLKFWTDENMCKNVALTRNSDMTSEIHSKLELIAVDNENAVCEVRIVAVNWLNISKKIGGDVFLLWAEQMKGNGRISGQVTDNNNGTYAGRIGISFSGPTKIRVKLGSTLENFCLRRRAMIKYGSSVFAMKQPVGIKGTFQNNIGKESTRCGINEKSLGYVRNCNLTKLNDGSPWFCGKPINSKLKCTDIYEYNIRHFERSLTSPRQAFFEIIARNGHAELQQTLEVNFKRAVTPIPKHAHATSSSLCCNRTRRKSWFVSGGYYLNGSWNDRFCQSRTGGYLKSYRKCLTNKTLVFLGDSTVRQYAAFFLSEVMQLPSMDLKNLKSVNRTYHPAIDFTRFGIRVIFKKHEMPFHYIHVPAKGITSVAGELLALSQNEIHGQDLIILINYNSHLQAFPPNQIRTRYKRIVKAIETLLNAKPETTVLLKGPHVYFNDKKWFDLRVSLIVKDLIFQEFRHLRTRIIYLDVWSISIAFNNEELHPQNLTFKSQIQQLMSYICCYDVL